MKHSKAQAYIRQLCCLGLGKEVLIPELLRAIHTVVPSESNVFTGVNGNMVPTYVIPEYVLPEVHLSDSARSLLFLATHGAFPVGSGPFQPGGRDAASVAANLRKSQRNRRIYEKMGVHSREELLKTLLASGPNNLRR